MFRKPQRKANRHTAPDHRPMLPEFRSAGDAAEEAVRFNRRRREEHMPCNYPKWR